MTGLSILLLLLMAPQVPKPTESAADRAKRAALNPIIVQPTVPGVARPAVRSVQVSPNIVFQQVQVNMKTMTLEYKDVQGLGDPDPAGGAVQQVARPVQIEEFALSSSNFDSWVFETDLTDTARRLHLDSILAGQIVVARADGVIGQEQEEKLLLAGRGDIKRFHDRVDAARANFEIVRQDFNAGRVALGQLEALAAEYQAGPFGSGSLFQKTVTRLRSAKEKKPQGRK